jgi:hypothetical protein
MRLGTWKVRGLYRSASLKTVARELANYKLYLVGVPEVRWDKEGTVRAGDYTCFMEMEIINWEQNFFLHQRIASALNSVEFVSNRMLYVALRGRWCDTISEDIGT